MQVRAGSLRLASVPLELRVREVEWWLGRNSAGHLTSKTHVQRFMRQEALWLVTQALEAADKAREVGLPLATYLKERNRLRKAGLPPLTNEPREPSREPTARSQAGQESGGGRQDQTQGGETGAPAGAPAEAAPTAADPLPEVRPAQRENSFVR